MLICYRKAQLKRNIITTVLLWHKRVATETTHNNLIEWISLRFNSTIYTRFQLIECIVWNDIQPRRFNIIINWMDTNWMILTLTPWNSIIDFCSLFFVFLFVFPFRTICSTIYLNYSIWYLEFCISEFCFISFKIKTIFESTNNHLIIVIVVISIPPAIAPFLRINKNHLYDLSSVRSIVHIYRLIFSTFFCSIYF